MRSPAAVPSRLDSSSASSVMMMETCDPQKRRSRIDGYWPAHDGLARATVFEYPAYLFWTPGLTLGGRGDPRLFERGDTNACAFYLFIRAHQT